MPEYQLEIKQIVDYPRCRVYREFVQALIADRSIRTNNGYSGLFYYIVLCSYVSFQTSHIFQNGICYTTAPGEWLCSAIELKEILRLRSFGQILDVLYGLQDDGLIQFRVLDRGRLVKYCITEWQRHNTVLGYNCPNQKNTGYFFIPCTATAELLGVDRCSEMDMVLDLWLSAVYRDERVQGSFDGPVVYLRNGSGSPFVSYSMLAKRWGRSKIMVRHILKKLCKLGYPSIFPSPEHQGMMLYLKNYFSAMFQISDIMVDKDELPLSLHLCLLEQEAEACDTSSTLATSKRYTDSAAAKALRILVLQGIACGKCCQCSYKLSQLYVNREEGPDIQDEKKYQMDILCGGQHLLYHFELTIRKSFEVVTSDVEKRCVK